MRGAALTEPDSMTSTCHMTIGTPITSVTSDASRKIAQWNPVGAESKSDSLCRASAASGSSMSA